MDCLLWPISLSSRADWLISLSKKERISRERRKEGFREFTKENGKKRSRDSSIWSSKTKRSSSQTRLLEVQSVLGSCSWATVRIEVFRDLCGFKLSVKLNFSFPISSWPIFCFYNVDLYLNWLFNCETELDRNIQFRIGNDWFGQQTPPKMKIVQTFWTQTW